MKNSFRVRRVDPGGGIKLLCLGGGGALHLVDVLWEFLGIVIEFIGKGIR